MSDIKNIDKIATTTAKFMDVLDEALAEMTDQEIVHVCVIADVRYKDGEEDCSHVILECDVDDRVVQIGITTAAQAATLFGDPLGDEND